MQSGKIQGCKLPQSAPSQGDGFEVCLSQKYASVATHYPLFAHFLTFTNNFPFNKILFREKERCDIEHNIIVYWLHD